MCIDKINKGSELDEELFHQLANDNITIQAAYYDEDEYDEELGEGYNSPGWVYCEILNECEDAYKDAIWFLTEIISNDFPVRCDFACDSKLENYIDIRERLRDYSIIQNSRSQFWANAAQYPSLHQAVRDYVKLAAEKVKFLYADEMEGDDSMIRRPDFYAATSLAMIDATGKDFADLLDIYTDTISMSAPNIIGTVVESFIRKYGITNENLPNLGRSEVRGFMLDPYLDCNPEDDEKISTYMKENGRWTEDDE